MASTGLGYSPKGRLIPTRRSDGPTMSGSALLAGTRYPFGQLRGEIMRSRVRILVLAFVSVVMLTKPSFATDIKIAEACLGIVESGLRDLAVDRKHRFLGKVDENRARCRGGDAALAGMPTPWVDWANYWAAGDAGSKATQHVFGGHIFNRNLRGVDGALVDLEYQRMELIKFNLANLTSSIRSTGCMGIGVSSRRDEN
jgi:hypothetical protein